MLTMSICQAMIENKGNSEVSNMSGPVSYFFNVFAFKSFDVVEF